MFTARKTNTDVVPKPDLPRLRRKDEPWLTRTAIWDKSIQRRSLRRVCWTGEDVASGDTNKLLCVLPYEACLGCRYECESSTCVDIAHIRVPKEIYIKVL